MINAVLALMIVAGNSGSIDNPKQLAETFLRAFLANPRSVAALVTQDALFATIDDRRPLADVIKDPVDETLKGCTSGPVTTHEVSRASVQNLPGGTFKKEGQFFMAEGSYLCTVPDNPGGPMMQAQTQLVIRDGKVAFFGIYPSRQP